MLSEKGCDLLQADLLVLSGGIQQLCAMDSDILNSNLWTTSFSANGNTGVEWNCCCDVHAVLQSQNIGNCRLSST